MYVRLGTTYFISRSDLLKKKKISKETNKFRIVLRDVAHEMWGTTREVTSMMFAS